MSQTTVRHQQICQLFLWAVVALVFCSYPLAAVPVYPLPFMHQWALPATLLLTLLALPVILGAGWRPAGIWFVLSLIYLSSVTVAWATGGQAQAAVELAGYLLIPWAIAVIHHDTDLLTWQRAGQVMTLLWASQVISGVTALALGREPIGFSGNRNWLAIVLLTSGIWAVVWLQSALRRWLKQPSQALGVSLVVVVPVTLWLVWACASRGAWLALLAAGALLAWWRFRRLERGLFIVFCMLLVLTVSVLFPQRVVETIRQDVRLPLIGRTVAMSIDHDLTSAAIWTIVRGSTAHWEDWEGGLGVGPGNFRQTFADYRAQSTYGERANAAAVTIHPHNEFLNLMAQIGLLGAVAWLLLFWPVLRRRSADNPLAGCAQLTVFLIFIHAMLDMPWVQPPSSIMGLVCLGVCWRLLPRAESSLAGWRQRLQPAVAILVSLLCAWLVVHGFRVDMAYRGALIAEAMQQPEKAVRLFQRMSDLAPREVLGNYSAARLAFEHLDRPDLARELLQEVVDQEPTYAHVNGLLGTVLLAQGEADRALQHLARECQLYPHEPAVLQTYINALILTNQPQHLPSLLARQETLIYQQAKRRWGAGGLTDRLEAWRAALAGRDPEAAIDQATTLVSVTPFTALDPLFHQLTLDDSWPHSFLQDGYNFADYAYWQQLRFAEHLLADAPADSGQERLAWLVEQTHQTMHIDDELPGFQFLDLAWREGKANPQSAYAGFAFLVRQGGYWPLLMLDEQDRPTGCLVQGEDVTWSVDLRLGTVRERDPQAALPARLAAFFYLQEFFLKNRTLGILQQQTGGFAQVRFDSMPAAMLWYQTRLAEPPGYLPFQHLGQLCYTYQIRHVYQRLQEELSP